MNCAFFIGSALLTRPDRTAMAAVLSRMDHMVNQFQLNADKHYHRYDALCPMACEYVLRQNPYLLKNWKHSWVCHMAPSMGYLKKHTQGEHTIIRPVP